MRTRTFIRRHPLAVYFGMTFAISWVGCFLAVGPKFLRGEALQFVDGLLLFLVMLAGPSLSGAAMAWLVDGKSGLSVLFAKMGRWRVARRWYAPLLVFPLLIMAVLLALMGLVSPGFMARVFPAGILLGCLAGFFEEIGWTGFAWPRMQPKRSAVSAAVLLGLIHSSWHLVADYLGAAGTRGKYWLPHFVVFIISMTAMRVLVAWVYANSGSLLQAQLMHASSTGFLAFLVPLSLSPAEDTLFYAVYAVALWLAAALIIARYGRSLKKQARALGTD